MYRNIPILYRVMESFFRYRMLFLISAVIITAIPAAVLLTRKSMYTATGLVQVVVSDNTVILGDTRGTGNWSTVAQQNVNKLNDQMSDDSMGGFVDKALQTAHLAHPISVDPRVRDPRLALLRKGLSLSTVSDTVFSINLVWDNSSECEEIVKALQAQYVEQIATEKASQAKATQAFLDAQLTIYSGKLRDAENKVIEFKRHYIGNTDSVTGALLAQSSEVKITLDELESSSHNNDLQRDIIKQRLAQISPTITSEKTYDYTHIKTPLEMQKDALEAEKLNLLTVGKYLPTSQRVTALDTQIAALKEQIDVAEKANPSKSKQVSNETVVDNPEYLRLQDQLTEVNISTNTEKAQVAILRQKDADYKAQIAKLPVAEQQLNEVMRPFNVLKARFEDLTKRRQDVGIKADLERTMAQSGLHGLGTVYSQPTGGKTKTAIMLGGLLIFGLLLGISVTVLAEWADPTLRYASDVERKLGVPVLISLPELEPLRLTPASASDSRITPDLPGGRPLLPARDE
ncbi:MAG: lipopolysaccharide biosynthesis protein [Chthonomonadales bacterium]|nr:lipopolysaccharide biosynthesis protein [Chthonomonadales bacterium]